MNHQNELETFRFLFLNPTTTMETVTTLTQTCPKAPEVSPSIGTSQTAQRSLKTPPPDSCAMKPTSPRTYTGEHDKGPPSSMP